MPDSPNRATSFPLLSLPAFLALAFVAGRFATHKLMLETARPKAKPSFLRLQPGEAQVRLWQDPLRAAQDDAYGPRRGARPKSLTERLVQVLRPSQAGGSLKMPHLLEQLKDKIHKRCKKDASLRTRQQGTPSGSIV